MIPIKRCDLQLATDRPIPGNFSLDAVLAEAEHRSVQVACDPLGLDCCRIALRCVDFSSSREPSEDRALRFRLLDACLRSAAGAVWLYTTPQSGKPDAGRLGTPAPGHLRHVINRSSARPKSTVRITIRQCDSGSERPGSKSTSISDIALRRSSIGKFSSPATSTKTPWPTLLKMNKTRQIALQQLWSGVS